MCKCIVEWTADEAVPEDNPHRLKPITCAEYIALLEAICARQAEQLGETSTDSFSWETTTKRLVDLKERVHQ